MRCATSTALAAAALSNMTANSSPPRRATVSLSRMRLAEAPSDLDQQIVAEAVAEGVVDLLEAIEVHHDHADRGSRAASALAIHVARWSRNSVRFGRPVRLSWRGLVADLLLARR